MRAGDLRHDFTQTFTYDERGAVLSRTHPDCRDYTAGGMVDCSGSAFTSTDTYQKGWLTQVVWPGNTSSIAYATSGLPSTITHPNAVIDTQTPDPDIPARPLAIVTTGATYQGVCVVPSFTTQPVSQTVLRNTNVTLTAAASGESGVPINYTWYEGVAPNKTLPRGTGPSLSRTITATTSFWVEASNTCPNGIANSTTATITACDGASATAAPNVTITRGQSTTLEPAISGSAPLTYQWYTVTGTTETAIGGATSATLLVSPTATTRYRIRVTNDCDTDSATTDVTVADPPAPPSVVQATYNGSSVVVTWSAGSSTVGVAGYRIERSDGRLITVGNVSSYSDGVALVPGSAYTYRVRARDTNGIYSDLSPADIATVLVFADDPRLSSLLIRGVHVSQLRQAIDAVRVVAGLTPAWTTYTPLTGTVRASDLSSLRDVLNEARALLELPEVTLTDTLASGFPIKGRTLDELRNGVR